MEHCNWQLTSCGEELTKSCANLCQLSEALPAELNFFWGERVFRMGCRKSRKIVENPLESWLCNLLGKNK